MSVKSDYIAAIRSTPLGIANFLTTAIPTLIATTLPATKDAAIITQGVLAHNLNTILLLFVGLTPIELLLRIGQHSSVLEEILFSGLEYIQNADQDHKIELQHPEAGKTYLPGELQIIVAEVNGTPTQVTATLNETSLALHGQAGFWVGTVTLETENEYTLNVTANYAKGDPATASAAFTIAATAAPGEPAPEPPGGTTAAAVEVAKAKENTAFTHFIGGGGRSGGAGASGDWEILKAAGKTFTDTAQAATTKPGDLVSLLSQIDSIQAEMDAAIQDNATADVLTEIAAKLQSAYNAVNLAI